MVSTRAKKRYLSSFIPVSWTSLRKRYSTKKFWGDVLGGVTVGVIALPVTMAFAIASGLDPQVGIFTSIVAGFIISLLGGSRVQISGTAGAFVAVIYDVVQRQGYEGLVFATLIAGVILILTGIGKLGNLIKYIPSPLVTGFTSGIAVIIFSSQIKEFFGLSIGKLPTDFLSQWKVYILNAGTWDPMVFALALGTLVLILLIKRYLPVVPWAIGSIVIATLFTWWFDLPVQTIAGKYGLLPRGIPSPSLPHFNFSYEYFRTIFPDALTIAFLAGSKSLLSALVADGMSGGKHKANCELVAVGLGNIASVLCGGMPATGAIARTATNIKTGGTTPVSGMLHSIVLFCIIYYAAPLASHIPIAALSAVLVFIAYNMCQKEKFAHLLKAPIGDVVVLLSAFLLTVLVDVTVAVEVGMILAAFLFMKRMSDIGNVVSTAQFFEDEDFPEKRDPDAISRKNVPKGVEVYEINGPFFFGVANQLKDILDSIEYPPKVFILRLRNVPIIDASGMYALREFYRKCKKDKSHLLISGTPNETLKVLKKFKLYQEIGKEHFYPTIDGALKASQQLVETITIGK